jgi:TonB-dependent receptor
MVKNFILSLITVLIISSVSIAQSLNKVNGKVLNNKNEALAGASISIEGLAGGTSTDIEGHFTLSIPVGKEVSLKITAVGYKPKTLTQVQATQEELNIVLEQASKNLEGVTVRASSIKRETVNSLIAYQKNTSTVSQVISAEAIRRSPDKNTGEVLKRIPGTSIQEGKYLVVRGLSDRYNQAMLNGILLGSTEPDRKTFSFDIFPSAMIDNIIINKSFIPELTGEWAGGLVQVNTKDVPSKNFLNVQIGTGFNSQTVGRDFYTYKGGKYDWLGLDDGLRGLPTALPTKSSLSSLDQGQKTAYGKQFENVWLADKNAGNFFPVLNKNFQINGGFNKRLNNNYKLGAIFAVNYNQSNKRTEFNNRLYSIQNNIPSLNFDYSNNKYSKDILWGALANFTLQLGNNNKISFKNLLNVNASNYVTQRIGKDFENNSTLGENIRASELALKSNTFFNTQLTGDHNLPQLKAKLHWYGSFNILDQYIPDQRRLQYNQDPTDANNSYLLLISASKTSQKSGSRYYGSLNDYIYNAGGDVTKSFNIGDLSQSIKAGYFFQVKDRLFDARPFAVYLPTDNVALRSLPADKVFSPENFGNGIDNKFAFNELFGNQYRYIANTILNAGFLQFDNQFANNLRVVWGVRVEDYDQVIGSMKQSDPRHVHSRVTDVLPGVNITYKVNDKTNLRLSGSQTVIRPEFRELSDFAFFDFDLGATVTGNKTLQRTKVTNADLRYEVYPRAGELITVGVFYKYFKNPIELYFNQSGAGSSSTFNFINADKAQGFGAELEFRKRLDFVDALRNFTFQTNLSYIYNRVERDSFQLKRPMQGQSPYVLNASLQYDIEKLGLNTTLLYNQIGDRILYVGGNDYPPVWEATRPIFDLQVAKKLMKNIAELKLNISDILNQVANYYHDLNDNRRYDKVGDALAIKRKYGTNFNISFSYNIK